MRFYKILVTSPSGTQLLLATSQANGQNVPGALDVELDIVSFSYSAPMGGSYVRIWGIPLKTISQATNLNYSNIQVYGGMAKGLPLANPAQQGLLAQGSILPAFGNWIGTEQTLDLILSPPLSSTQDESGKQPNLVLNWLSGTKLSDALTTCLSTAYPTFKPSISISDNLVASYDQVATYDNMEQLNAFLKPRTKAIINSSSYLGVDLTVRGDQIVAFDGSLNSSAAVKQIEFRDLIGQPTWINAFTLQFKCAMRGDLSVSQIVSMPPTITTQTSASSILPRSNSVFQGKFMITQVRHTGRFRQPDASAWVTTVDAIQLDQS